MTKQEETDIAVIQNDVKWIREKIETYCKKVSNLERLVYIGLGIVLAIEGLLAYIK